LLPDGCRADHQEPAAAFGPKLAKHDTSLDRLAEPDLVGEHDALGERRSESEQGCFDLMRV
jgi:hypothetical protein